jgi:hypothetical protein
MKSVSLENLNADVLHREDPPDNSVTASNEIDISLSGLNKAASVPFE